MENAILIESVFYKRMSYQIHDKYYLKHIIKGVYLYYEHKMEIRNKKE